MMSVKNTKTSKHELHRWDLRKPMLKKDQSGTPNNLTRRQVFHL